MVEHTRELGQDTVEIMKAVAPFDNVVRTGRTSSGTRPCFRPAAGLDRRT